MVLPVSNLFIDSFDAEVKLAYQGTKSLRETVRVKNGVVGSTHRFPKAGRGVATQHNSGNDVVAMNAGRDKVICVLSDWDAFDYSDILDIEKINFDDKRIIVDTCAKAIGRREDQLIIDALTAELAVVGTSMETVGNGTTGFTLQMIQDCGRIFDTNNVPTEGRYMVLSPRQKEELLGNTETTSIWFNSVRTLVSGDISAFYGFNFVFIGNRDEGGLPLESTVRTGYAYHKQAVGLAIGKDMQTMVDWVAVKTAWQLGAVYSAGAVVIDSEGCIAIKTLDNN